MNETIEEKILKFLYFDNSLRTSTELAYYIEGGTRKAGEYALVVSRLEKMGYLVKNKQVRTNEHNLKCEVVVYTITVMGEHQHEIFSKNKASKIKKLDFRNHILTKDEAASRR